MKTNRSTRNKNTNPDRPGGPHPGESDHDRIRWIPVNDIHPAPENDKIYRPVNRRDPDFQALVQSVRRHGIYEPLIIDRDFVLGSGHRRLAAAVIAGLKAVPCIVCNVRYATHPDAFLQLIVECNQQRRKSFAEKVHEEVLKVNPDKAYLCPKGIE